MNNDTTSQIRTNLVGALTEPATFRTLIIAAAIVIALITATGGSINVGASNELIQELRLTGGQITGLSDSIQSLRDEIAELDYRVERLEEGQPPPDDGE